VSSAKQIYPRAHRRQFVLGPRPVRPNENWRSENLGADCWLSYDKDLPVLLGSPRATGDRVVLLGTAVDAIAGKAVRADQLDGISLPGYLRATERWVGRWALLHSGKIVGDIGGLLGILYERRAGGDTDSKWVSSSQVLLCQVTGRPLEIRSAFTISPTSRVVGIDQLLPGQAFDLRKGEVELVDPVPFRPSGLGESETMDLACSLILGAMRGFAAITPSGQLFVGLSGGSDSRRNAAAAKAAGLPTRLYTFYKPKKFITDADARLPSVVAARLGLPHQGIFVDKPLPSRQDDWIAHVGIPQADLDRPGSNFYYYTRGYFAELGYPVTTIEGQCYELTSNYYYPDFWRIRPDFVALDCVTAHCECTEADLARADQFWASLRINLEIDRRDLLFWSFAMNSVYANLYFESDLWTDAYCTANCGLLYSCLLSLPPALRNRKKFLDRVTLRLAPELAGIPVNPPDSFGKRNLARSKAYLRHVREYGLADFVGSKFRKLWSRGS